MVKLSAELIEQAAQYTNPVRDRELDLRGYKIPVLENLGATLDQFDTIDFSDNEVRKLDGFPLLKRLKTVLINNNRICRIGENLEQSLPNLKELVLTSNNIQELGDLDPLASVKTLTLLSLLRNPVTNKKHYRLYVINKLPQIRVLDFQKVKLKERQEAEKMFKGKRGAQLAKDIAKRTKTFTPGVGLQADKKKMGPSAADVEAIKNAIANATSLAEVERLKGLLQSGQIPGRENRQDAQSMVEEEEEEEMERGMQAESVSMYEAVGGDEMEGDDQDGMNNMEEDMHVNVSTFLSDYGWYFLVLCGGVYLLVQQLRKNRPSQHRGSAAATSQDAASVVRRQEALEAARQRMQEELNAKAAEFKEKQQRMEEEKRQQKIEKWESMKEGKSYKGNANLTQNSDEAATSSTVLKPKTDKKPIRTSGYNPLSGEGGGTCAWRPGRRGPSAGG
uniref:U2A'/phosphoprotein 32 family A C-terminal domain-containing protein n=1 Tax=Pygocentrus nattereri TaxID=42514 RepID=A0AAR2IY31_PYGNA